MKRAVRILVVLAVAGAALALVARLLRGRATPPSPAGVPSGEAAPEGHPEPPVDDLAEVKGIGPVYRARLAEAGITRFGDLATADPAFLAEAAGVTEERAADWVAQAAALTRR